LTICDVVNVNCNGEPSVVKEFTVRVTSLYVESRIERRFFLNQ